VNWVDSGGSERRPLRRGQRTLEDRIERQSCLVVGDVSGCDSFDQPPKQMGVPLFGLAAALFVRIVRGVISPSYGGPIAGSEFSGGLMLEIERQAILRSTDGLRHLQERYSTPLRVD